MAIVLAKWETRFVRKLLRWYKANGMLNTLESLRKIEGGAENFDIDSIRFGVQDNIIISPEDPASKYIYKPLKFRTYVIDDGYFFTTTREANTRATSNIQKSITGNRKMNVGMYWIFPNIFKMPTAILEVMDIWIHKENMKVGDVIIPSRVIQVKEKFSREKVEKYAQYPRRFKFLIRKHPSFVAKVRFPRLKGKGWDNYISKYERYKWAGTQHKDKESKRIEFFKQLEKVLEKDIKVNSSIKDREQFIRDLILNAVKKRTKSDAQANQMAASFTDQFIKWQEESLASQLTRELSSSLIDSAQLSFRSKDDEEETEEGNNDNAESEQ